MAKRVFVTVPNIKGAWDTAYQIADAVIPLFRRAHPSPTPAASVCDACGDKGYVESEGGDGEGWPSKREIEACPRCAPTPAADADRVRIAELEAAVRNARRQLNDMQGDCVFYNLGSVLPEVVAEREAEALAALKSEGK